MDINSLKIQHKVKAFLKYNFKQELFFSYKNESFIIFKIFLEDIFSYDKELYFLLLKKPEKVIFILEFSLKKLIEKFNFCSKKEIKRKNFQLILMRKFFKIIPKKWNNISEGEFVSLKVTIVSISILKLKTREKAVNFNPKGITENLIKTEQFSFNYSDKLITSDLLSKKKLNFFVDYQTAKAIGVLETKGSISENIDIVLILEGIFTKKFFPGDEIFVSGISVLNGFTKYNEEKSLVIRVIGFSKISFANKFRISNSFDDLDKKFIKFAHSKNIYNWIYSLVIPEIQNSIDFKRAISCLLFGGNEKILANNYFSKGQINILVIGGENEVFRKTTSFLKNLIQTENNVNKGFSLENFSCFEIYKICENSGILLIENFENLNFDEQLIVKKYIESKTFPFQKELLEDNSCIFSTMAFTNVKNKIFYSQSNFTSGSTILMENLKNFDLIISSSLTNEITYNKKNFDMEVRNDLTGVKFNINSFEFLKYYILFVKKKFKPKLSKKAAEMFKNAYLFLKISSKKSYTLSIHETNRIREVESMIKISEAFCKMRMVNQIDSSDALEAIRLIQKFKL